MPAFSKRTLSSRTASSLRAGVPGLTAAVVVFLTSCLCGAFLYARSVQALKEEVRGSLIRTATVAAAMVDGDAHTQFTDPRQETTPAYFRAIKPLAQVQQASGDIKYIYTCILRQNKVYFVLDPTPPGDHNGDGIDEKSHVMQLYPDAAPAMLAALRTGRPQADAEPTRDEWGMLISGYAPIHDSSGRMVGIVGVDLTADRYIARLASMHRAALSGLLLAGLLSMTAGGGVFAGQRRLLQSERSRSAAAAALFQAHAALQQAHEELEARVEARTADLAGVNQELHQAYHATIEGWARALDLRDHETEGHCRRVTEMTQRLARAVFLTEDELVHVRRGALLHDIGKMGVPDSVLLKPGPLTADEWEIMRRHPALAHEMLAPAGFLRPALEIPYSHHEKWDGTGYPQGLAGQEIPLSARIFAIVDVWDALSSDRPYRKAWPAGHVLDHLRGLSGTHFDPALVPVFLRLLEEEAAEGNGVEEEPAPSRCLSYAA